MSKARQAAKPPMIPQHIAPEGVPFGRARELERLAQRSEADLRLRLHWKEKDAAPRSGCALVELTSERVETRSQRVRTQHKKLPAAKRATPQRCHLSLSLENRVGHRPASRCWKIMATPSIGGIPFAMSQPLPGSQSSQVATGSCW